MKLLIYCDRLMHIYTVDQFSIIYHRGTES